MTTTPIPALPEGVPSPWRRIGSWLEQWAEVLDFDTSEHHEGRIARLEREVATLRSTAAVRNDTASSLQPADKEVS